MHADPPARSDPRARAPAVETRAAALACLLACAALVLAGVFPVNNPDTYGHLAQGRQIAELGRVPAHDTFSIWQARPAQWHNYEWLSDYLGWSLYRAAGPSGLIALKCAMLAAAAAALAGLAWLLGGPRAAIATALLLVAAIPASRFRFTERPHVIALPFAALYLIGFAYLLRAWGSGRRRADALVIGGLAGLHVVWVNAHGSHLLGLLLTAIHVGFATRPPGARARLAAVLGLQLVASCMSPFGPAIVIDALEHTLDPSYRQLVIEWEAWSAEDPPWLMGAPLLQTLLLAVVVRALWRGGPTGRALLASSLVLALAAFRSIRFVAEYLLLSAPAIAVGCGAALRAAPFRPFAAAALSAGVLIAAVAAWSAPRLPPRAAPGLGASDVGLPAASGGWLAARAVAPRVFAAVEDSWYLMFAVPRARFVVDGRIPFYGPEHMARVRKAMAGEPALGELITRYRVDAVVVRNTFAPQRRLLADMSGRAGWALVAVEDRYALFVHGGMRLADGSRPRALALRPGYELDWLLAADAAGERAILTELARQPAHPNTRGYAGWVRAVLALKPLLRRGGSTGNGLRPASETERAVLERAQRWLALAAKGAQGVPIVHAYHALVATARCDLDTAERAFALARREGDSRETLLGAQELALRRGERAAVQAFLQRAASMPGAAADPWLAALRDGLRAPPVCP
jgi:hypothetical protein